MTVPSPSAERPGEASPGQASPTTARLTLRLVALVLAAMALALVSLVPAHDRTLLIGRPGDTQKVARFHLPSRHLDTPGRWTRGDGTIVVAARYPAPAVLSLRLAPPAARVPDVIEVVVNGVQLSRHTLAAGWNAIEVPVDPRIAPESIALQIRSAATSFADGRPHGVFVERVTLKTGGLPALRATPFTTWLWLSIAWLAALMTIHYLTQATAAPSATANVAATGTANATAAASGIAAPVAPLAAAAFILIAGIALIGFRPEILARLPLVSACCWAAAAYVIAAGKPGLTRRVESLSPGRAILLFSVAALLLIGLLFPDAWRRGYVLSQADMFYEYFPWRAHIPAEYQTSDRPPLGDIPMMVYPFLTFAQARWREWVFPLWTTAMNAGQPFLGTFQCALFSPLTWVAAVVPLPQATVWIAVLRLLVGGVGLFAFLRAIGVSRWGAAFGGVTFLLNPFSLVWLEHPPGGVPPWLPWMLLAAERSTRASTARPAADVAWLAIATALVLAGGHPHTGMFAAMLGGSYGLVRALMSTPRLRRSLRVATALALGIALVAAQVLPFLEYLSLSHGTIWRNNFALNPFIAPSSTLITAIVPNFLGHHGYGNYAGPTNYLEQQIYPGIATWMLAAVGLVFGARRWRTWFFAAAALTALLVMYGTPGVHELVSSLPLVRAASLPRVGIVTFASLAVLAAFGVDDLLCTDPGRRRRWLVTLTLVVSATILAVLARDALHARSGFLESRGLVAFATRWTGLALGLAAATTLVSLAGLWRLTSRPRAASALIGLVACDLLVFGYGFHSLIPPQQVFPMVPEIEMVRQDRGLFRVMGAGGALMPNAAMVYGLQDVRGYDGLTVARYAELLQAAFVYENQVHSAVNLQSPLIDLLNVKYVFGVPNIPAPEGWFTKVTEGEAPLYRNTRVFPRAFLVDQYVIRDGNPARRTLRDGLVDLHRIALLEQDPPAAERPVRAPTPDQLGTVTVTHYRDHFVELQADAPDRRLLVLTDVHYPGWVASIDGRPATIHRANFAFRALAVPPGRHTVTFAYRPTSFRLGLSLSTAAAAILLALILYARRRAAPAPVEER